MIIKHHWLTTGDRRPTSRLENFEWMDLVVAVLVLAVLVCGRFGFSVWPFWYDLWPFWFVAVLDVIRNKQALRCEHVIKLRILKSIIVWCEIKHPQEMQQLVVSVFFLLSDMQIFFTIFQTTSTYLVSCKFFRQLPVIISTGQDAEHELSIPGVHCGRFVGRQPKLVW